jgi:23S rRNA (cytosine1962-C5)-methyltransferase
VGSIPAEGTYMNEILITKPSTDYELIDSGEGEKLERYGKIVLSRPDPQALWPKSLSQLEWQKANAIFNSVSKDWKFKENVPNSWAINFGGLKFLIKPSPFKHTGLFPEQLSNWQWIEKQKAKQVLNLFGYTGGASLAASKASATVVHLDGSKSAITWARENAKLSGLEKAPIRWILDDARKFLKREIKRGNKYDGIIMDPPAFGHGPHKELWKIEDHFLDLMDLSFQVLSDTPTFFLINGYASGYSATAYANNLKYLTDKFEGKIEKGELTIEESRGKRLLPCGIFARWSK